MSIPKEPASPSETKLLPQKREDNKTLIKDCAFLGSVLLILQSFMIWDLGFYSDDWAFLSILHNAQDQSIKGLILDFFTQEPLARMRPVQIANVAILYSFFGLNPTGYHIVNSLFILSSIILIYLSLRLLKLPRLLLIGIPLIYSLLPHYSTDRIWMAAFQTNISIMFFFLNFIAIIKCNHAQGKAIWLWGTLSLISVALSILSYEVILPLFLVSFFAIMWHTKEKKGITFKAFNKKVTLLLLCNLLAFSLCVLFKAWISVRTGGFYTSYWQHLWYVFTSVIKNDFIFYGLKLPKVIWLVFRNHFNLTLVAVGIPLGIFIFIYLQKVRSIRYKLLDWLRIILAGVVVFWAGYAIFLTTAQFGTHPTGLTNRIAMAASLGVATCFLGAIGFISALLPSERLSKSIMSFTIASLCTVGFMINYTIATFFHKAYPIQLEILSDVQKQIPVLAENSILILDGICPYMGPAPVFECHWDVAGALQIHYDMKNVRGDVRTELLKYNEQGVTTTIYGDDVFYPYGENLIVYNYQNKEKVILTNKEAADTYFVANKLNCPSSKAGHGVAIF